MLNNIFAVSGPHEVVVLQALLSDFGNCVIGTRAARCLNVLQICRLMHNFVIQAIGHITYQSLGL